MRVSECYIVLKCWLWFLQLASLPPSTSRQYLISSFFSYSVLHATMRSTISVVLAALAAREVAGHALFQQLWVDSVDMISLPTPFSSPRTERRPRKLINQVRIPMYPHAPIQHARHQRRRQRRPLQRRRKQGRQREVSRRGWIDCYR